MVTLKASKNGRLKIDRARKSQGWTVDDFRWLESASDILGVSWQQSGYLAEGISEGTWKRFVSGKYAVNVSAFKAYCQILGLEWQEIIERKNYQDWGKSVDVEVFFGRTQELSLIQQWIIRDCCRSLTLLGMGGIGKTFLALKAARLIEDKFEFVIWRSLRNAPEINDLLADLIQFFSQQQNRNLPPRLDVKITLLLKYLQRSRCLLILDNVESVIYSGRYSVSQPRPQSWFVNSYSQLFYAIAQTQHQSCLLLTSREPVPELVALEGDKLPVRCLQLEGLAPNDARNMLREKGLILGSATDCNLLVARYEGNPLALKVAAATIQELFAGKIGDFFNASDPDPVIFNDISDLLQQQLARLNSLEQQIMYWLAVNRESISLLELQQDLVFKVPTSKLLLALTSLKKRSLIIQNASLFRQQTVILEYVTARLIEQITKEIQTKNIDIFNRVAIVKYQARDYLSKSQEIQILQPLVAKLVNIFSTPHNLIEQLNAIIDSLHTSGNSQAKIGYLTGNIINIFNSLKVNLSNYNFSGLTIWQANFQGVKLHNVNFANADLAKSTFTTTLGNVLSAAFSPDGKILATGDTDCQIRFWSVKTGQLLATGKGHNNWVRSIAFSPDGKTLISGSGDRTAKFWQVDNATCIKTCRGHESEIFSVAYSPDGRALASASGDNIVRIWDTATATCIGIYQGHTNSIRSVAFSPDGNFLASGSDDHTIRIWDLQNQKCQQSLTGHQGWIRSLAFSQDGQALASGSGDGTIKLWSLDLYECLVTYELHNGDVSAVAFSPDGVTLASGSRDCTVRLWNYHTHTCVRTIYGHTNQIFSLAFNPQGKTIVCVSLDRTVRIWDCRDGKCLKTWRGNTDWVSPVAYAADGSFFANITNETVNIWNNKGKCLRKLSGHRDYICSLAFHPQGKIIASSSRDNTIRLWDTSTGKCLCLISEHEDWVYVVAFSADGNLLASGSADQTLRLWDSKTGKPISKAMEHPDTIWSVAFSADGQTIATGNTDRQIRLWDVATAECRQTLNGHSDRVLSVAFSPITSPESILASGSIDGTVKLWNCQENKAILTLVGHQNWVFSVVFSPDGCTLASGSHDRTIRIWDVATGECKHICQGHEHLVASVAFSPCGRQIISGSQDQTLRIWDVATGKCLQILQAARLYEGTNITAVRGLTTVQKSTLKTLGAVD